MKYLVKWEFDSEKAEKLIEKEMKYQKLIKETPEKYPKNFIPLFSTPDGTVYTIWEVDKPEQIANKIAYMMPEGRAKLVPLMETEKFIEAYMKTKKQA